MTATFATDSPFGAEQERTLVAFAGAFLPASAEYGVPGADDADIAADILATAKRNHVAVAEALRGEDELAHAKFGAAFADLDNAARASFIDGCNQAGFFDDVEFEKERIGPFMAAQRTLVSIIVQCYYRDDRVMRSLGMEPRSPYPDGFEVEDGDWSLLEPVKGRGKLYRDVD